MARVSVLILGLNNHKRSVVAQYVMIKQIQALKLGHRVRVSSAGIHACYAGLPADLQTLNAARQHELDLSPHQARQFRTEESHQYHYILTLNDACAHALHTSCGHTPSLKQAFTRYHPHALKNIPDLPHDFTQTQFTQLLTEITLTAHAFITHITRVHQLR